MSLDTNRLEIESCFNFKANSWSTYNGGNVGVWCRECQKGHYGRMQWFTVTVTDSMGTESDITIGSDGTHGLYSAKWKGYGNAGPGNSWAGWIAKDEFAICATCPVDTYNDKIKVNGEDQFLGTPVGGASATRTLGADKFRQDYRHFCFQCLANEHTNGQRGQESCTTCPHGTYRPVCGAGAVDDPQESTDVFYTSKIPGDLNCETGCLQCPTQTVGSSAAAELCCTPGKFYSFTTRSCEDCPANTYSDFVGAQKECLKCPMGMISTSTSAATGSTSISDLLCDYCSAGSYNDGSTPDCQTCATGKYSDAGASQCEDCPTGKYYETETCDNRALKSGAVWTDSVYECKDYTEAMCQIRGSIESQPGETHKTAKNACCVCGGGYRVTKAGATTSADHTIDACLPCPACGYQEYRSGCSGTSRGICEPCAVCDDGMKRVNCRRDAGSNGAEGECKPTELLSPTPFCSQQFTSVDKEVYDMSVGLSGFSYSELFGVPNSSYVTNFQCRDTCQGTRADTNYCGGPYACGARVCSTGFTQDGEPDFRRPRACPVVMDDKDYVNAGLDNVDKQVWKIGQGCQDCNDCGDGGTSVEGPRALEVENWGRGCANECSRLMCGVGEIFDFTDKKCKRCDELLSIELCPSERRAEMRDMDISGNAKHVQREGCRGRPGSVDLDRINYSKEDASPDPQYGNCEECTPKPCDNSFEYPDTCSSCRMCVPHGLVKMKSRDWVNLEGVTKTLHCQMQTCAEADRKDYTLVQDDGALCTDPCLSAVDFPCAVDEVAWPCQMPFQRRCRPRWPGVESARDAKTEVSNLVDVLYDVTSQTIEYAGFENALVNTKHELKHRHVCVWNAMDIRDNVMTPGGISRTLRTPGDTIDAIYSEVGTKFCHPVYIHGGEEPSENVKTVAWRRRVDVEYPMLPLQNTLPALDTGEKSRYIITNTSASVMHYQSLTEQNQKQVYVGNGNYYPNIPLPTPPPGENGDLFIALDLKGGYSAHVAVQLNHAQSVPYSLLFTAWTRVLYPPERYTNTKIQSILTYNAAASAAASAYAETRVWFDETLMTHEITTPQADAGVTVAGLSFQVASVTRFRSLHEFSEHSGGNTFTQSNTPLYVSSKCAGCLSTSWPASALNDETSTDYTEFQVVDNGNLPSEHLTYRTTFHDLTGGVIQMHACALGLLTADQYAIKLLSPDLQPRDVFDRDEDITVDFAVLALRSAIDTTLSQRGVVLLNDGTNTRLNFFTIDQIDEELYFTVPGILLPQYISTGEQKSILSIAAHEDQLLVVTRTTESVKLGIYSVAERMLHRTACAYDKKDTNFPFECQSSHPYNDLIGVTFEISGTKWPCSNVAIRIANGNDDCNNYAITTQTIPLSICGSCPCLCFNECKTKKLSPHCEQQSWLRAELTSNQESDIELSLDSNVEFGIEERSASLLGLEEDNVTPQAVVVLALQHGLLVADIHGHTTQLDHDKLSDDAFPVCKPSLAWTQGSNFVLGVGCQGLLWRGSSSVGRLTLNPITSANFLRHSMFALYERTWWRVGVHIIKNIDNVDAQSLQLQHCADGYDIKTGKIDHNRGIFKENGIPCSWQCTHTPLCIAYEVLSGADESEQCILYNESPFLVEQSDANYAFAGSQSYCEKNTDKAKRVVRLLRDTQAAKSKWRFLNAARNFQKIVRIEGFEKTTLPAHGTALAFVPSPLVIVEQSDVEFNLFDSIGFNFQASLPSIKIKRILSYGSGERQYATAEDAILAQIENALPVRPSEERNSAGSITTQSLELRLTAFTDPNTYLYAVLDNTLSTIQNVITGNMDDATGRRPLNKGINILQIHFTQTSANAFQAKFKIIPEDPSVPYNYNIAPLIRLTDTIHLRYLFKASDTSALAIRAYVQGFEPRAQDGLLVSAHDAAWHRLVQVVPAALLPDIEHVGVRASRTEINGDSGDVKPRIVVGVDTLSLLPLTSEVPAYQVSADELAVAIRAPPIGDTRFEAVTRGSDATDWERLHVRALATGSNCELNVRIRKRTHFVTPAAPEPAIHKLGCVIAADSDECFFELPLKPAEASELAVSFSRAAGDSCVMPLQDAVFVTLAPPHASLYECPRADFYFDADLGECVYCEVDQEACTSQGEYHPGCAALEDTASNACELCLDHIDHTTADFDIASGGLYIWDDATVPCAYTCTSDYFRSDDTCAPCSSPNCAADEDLVACTGEVDAHCVPCVKNVEHGAYAEFETFELHSTAAGREYCKTRCQSGHYRSNIELNGSPCVPCSTLEAIQVVSELTRKVGDFFRFQPCSAISDLQAVACPTATASIVGTGAILVGDATEVGGACQYQCLAGQEITPAYPTSEVIDASTTSNLPSNSQLVDGKALETFSTTVAFKAVACTACTTPGGSEGTDWSWVAGAECAYECISGRVMWPPGDTAYCQHCSLICSSGEFLTGNLCDRCDPCKSGMKYQEGTGAGFGNWQFTGRGVLGDENSCPLACWQEAAEEEADAEEAAAEEEEDVEEEDEEEEEAVNDDAAPDPTGYFRAGDVCLQHSTEPGTGCGAGLFWRAGTELLDGACLPCTSCEGMYRAVACTNYADATCVDCGEHCVDDVLCQATIEDTKKRVGVACAVECIEGYVLNTATGECEDCREFHCEPGNKFVDSAARTSCQDCVACPVPPSNSNFVFECEYACPDDHALVEVAEAAGTSQLVCQPSVSGQSSHQAQTALIRQIRCLEDETLSESYTCVKCTVQTPPSNQKYITWNWLGHACRWECVDDRLYYQDSTQQVHCVTWTAFKTSIRRTPPAFVKKFSRIKHVAPRLNPFEIVLFFGVLLLSTVANFLS